MMIFSAYRKDQYVEPDAFAEQLRVVLAQYDRRVIEAVSDPRNSFSVQMRFKHPPTINEIAEACSEEAERQFKMAKAARQPRVQRNWAYVAPPKFPGCRANIFVHAEAPQYAALAEWSQTAEADACDWKLDEKARPGIWIALSVWQTMGRVRSLSAWQSPGDEALRASMKRMASQPRAEEFFDDA